MPGSQQRTKTVIRFGTFEADLDTQELRNHGVLLRLPGQSFQVLRMLLDRRGTLVTRDEMRTALWPSDTFVDFDHGVHAAVNRLREALGDSADSPRWIETLPRRGYRFIAPIENSADAHPPTPLGTGIPAAQRFVTLRLSLLLGACVLLAGVGLFVYERMHRPASNVQRALTRLTLNEGLQFGATWSPDGRFVAYSSDRGGKFDVWVQQVSGGDPVQITRGSGHNWQPEWSPDGKYIAYRSEAGDGGLFVIPALGGAGLERRLTTFGYYPRWSPDSSQLLFQTSQSDTDNRFYVAKLDGSDPHEVLRELTEQLWVKQMLGRSAAWYPDGKRISVWVSHPLADLSFWTAPVTGGSAVRSEISPEILKSVGAASRSGIEGGADFKFSWAPSGTAIYFSRTLRGARSIWRMRVDPQTLRPIAIERLTTGTGSDTELSLSPDGKKLAFTGGSYQMRAWLFPFDATRGQVIGPGEPVTPPGIEAWMPTLSRDGKKLAFRSVRGDNRNVWETSLSDGHWAPIMADDYMRELPEWSPDGTQLVYRRDNSGAEQLMLWSSQSRTEEPLTEAGQSWPCPYDWSPDGKWLLMTELNGSGRGEIWLLPVAAKPHAEREARRIASDPAYHLWQGHFSPNGRWIAFNAERFQPGGAESTIYVMSATGGPWIRITEGKHWDDKPRWSPDGNIIYFLSERAGFFNVWGIRFDSARARPVGEPFPVTTFSSPRFMVAKSIGPASISLTQDRLVVTVAQLSGSIWLLENVDR
jgi:Tol biopolymer transport system component/DNA-binding winged helix-turn-helix (wHTH) protein